MLTGSEGPALGFFDSDEDTASLAGGSDLAKAMKKKGNKSKDKLRQLLCRLVKENTTPKKGKPAKYSKLDCPKCDQ